MERSGPTFAEGVDLGSCLGFPEFASARMRVRPEGLDELITWVISIEWPVEDFVSPNDMVLTTGMGCDEAQLCELVRLIAERGATVVCISTGDGAIHRTLPRSVLEAAQAAGIALMELPWRVRFSDLSRAVVAALYDEGVEVGGSSRLEARGRDRFLWEVAANLIDSGQELATRAALLGLEPRTDYVIGVGVLEPAASEALGGTGEALGTAGMRALTTRMSRHLANPSSVIADLGGELLFMLCGQQDVAKGLSGELSHALPERQLTLGFAAGRYNLTMLAAGVSQARTVRDIVRERHGAGAVGRGDRLQAYLLLAPCVDDEAVRQRVDEVLGGLEQADALRRSALIHTLGTFLENNGNIASAARELHLNRHSLTYRLRKINELSGLDVGNPDDRLVLTIALRIRDLQRAVGDGSGVRRDGGDAGPPAIA